MSQNVQNADRPERSRNAKAQARHRAKRKAYIEQLEQTVTKLQTAMGVTPEQVAVLPPPLAKIRELEQENARLAKENDEFRRLLADAGIPVTGLASSNGAGYASSPSSFNPPARAGAFHDARNLTDSYGGLKRRKMSSEHLDSNFPSENTDLSSLRAPPPPLTIPHHSSSSNHYPSSHPSSHLSSPHPNSAHGPPSHHAFPSLGPPPFQPPSASSATSSPPFSASFSH
ncbi:hypothetical protein GYMLUDRAFT_35808 [Collybiopsis luxurians FD-317 M1]|nr:hypothetical protein GYMLUDRAFT_35808 [Collybiopsis luxurians FD-317 M1]